MRVTTKLGYGVGQLSEGVKQAAFNTFLFFYYNQVLGLPGSLVGMAALLALVVDAITDPMVGQMSDRLRSRWGRRHPFMLAGAIPFGFAIIALFSPPVGLSESGLFAWLLGWAIAVRLMLTLFFVPHLSLGAELVTDYYERTSLIGYRVFFTYAGILVTTVTGFALFFPATDEFPNGLLNAASYPSFGIFCAVLAVVAMLTTVIATWSSIPYLSQSSSDGTESSPLLAFISVFKTLKQKAFRVLFSATLLFNTLAGVVQTLLVYMATFVFGFEPQHLAGLAGSVLVGIVFASPVAQAMARKLDKKRALAFCVVIGSLFAGAPMLLYLAGLLTPMPIVTKFSLVFILNGVSQIFFIAYIILLDSMLSDTIDENELNTGKREEGLFFASRAFATKASYGLGSFFAGVGLDVIKFPRNATPENVPPEAVAGLATMGGPVLMVLFICSILISNRYPLNAQRHAEIIRLNSARVGKSGREPVPSA